MKAAIHLLIFVRSLLIAAFVAVSNAGTAFSRCSEVPCVANWENTTCEQLLLDYDLAPYGCCFSLSDNGSGDCLISMVSVEGGDSSMGYCSLVSRVGMIFSAGENVGEAFGKGGGGVLTFQITNGNGTLPDECPTSDYPFETSSVGSMLPNVSMRLHDIGYEWTEQDTTEWKGLTEAHTVDFFTANPESGFRDVLTYTQVYPNGGAIYDNGKDKATLIYLQYASFRINPDATGLINSTVSDLLDIAFNSPTGHSMYLAALQGSSNPTLSAATDFTFSSMGDLPGGEGEVTSRPAATTRTSPGAAGPTSAPGTDSAKSAAGVFQRGWKLLIVSALLTVLNSSI